MPVLEPLSEGVVLFIVTTPSGPYNAVEPFSSVASIWTFTASVVGIFIEYSSTPSLAAVAAAVSDSLK